MLDPTTTQFLVDILAVAIAAMLVVVAAFSSHDKISARGRPLKKRVSMAKRSGARKARPNTPAGKRTIQRKIRLPSPVLKSEDARSPVPTVEKRISTCPSCGLEAPEPVMEEHLLGSPSHRTSKPPVEVKKPDLVSMREETPDEDYQGSLRHLLQMLVPPRAFGHRHQQKTENPISSWVHLLDPLQRPLIEPLGTSA